MKKILLIGAGLSSAYLIQYLSQWAAKHNGELTVADADLQLAQNKINLLTHTTAQAIEVNNNQALSAIIESHDIVVSLLPPALHFLVAKGCLLHRKNLVTASYLTPEMESLHHEASELGLLFLNECGLDPGIDHLSAMKMIDEIKAKGAKISSFKSYCGGLIAPEFDTNPWGYKFTWNPRNVVVAGQATAKYKWLNEIKFIPPQRIFSDIEHVAVNGREFDGYANRDSLSYIKPYGLTDAETVIRGTLRKTGFCNSWNWLVKLGLTDNQQIITDANSYTYREWVSAFTPGNDIKQLEKRISNFLQLGSSDMEKLLWLGLFDDKKIAIESGTSADILQHLLQHKWALNPGDLDQIVMQHECIYTLNEKKYKHLACLIVNGENEKLTAMAKTVGLPLGIATKLILENKVKQKGVCIPLTSEFYLPILAELGLYHISFTEQTTTY